MSTIDLCNSGDTAGSRDRVVGYGAWVFTEGSPTENKDDAEEEDFGSETRALLARHGVALLHLAAASIEYGLNNAHALPVDPADHANDLSDHGACFVTLKRKGKLRGCIGSPRAHRSLVVDVAENSYSAAFSDRRFSKLRTVEKRGLSVSISLLSDSFPMRFTDEADLLRQMRPGTDGLIIADKKRRSLFLPAVWNSLPVPSKFLSQLKVKAGLGANHWSAEFKAWRFITVDISTSDLDNPASVWSGYHTLTRRHH